MFYMPTNHPDWALTPGGILLPAQQAEQLSRVGRNRYGPGPLGLDVFAGAGGFSLGMKMAGIEVIGMFEFDPAAASTYMMNLCRYGEFEPHWATPDDKERLEKWFNREIKRMGRDVAEARAAGIEGFLSPEAVLQLGLLPHAGSGWIHHHPEVLGTSHVFFGDVTKFSSERILGALGLKRGELDVLFGGPPCQGFSKAGKRDVMDPRNSLVFEFARLVVDLQPRTFVMENVVGLTSMVTPEGIPVLDKFCEMVADGGWATFEALQKVLGVEGRRTAVRGRSSAKATMSEEPDDNSVGFGPLFGGEV